MGCFGMADTDARTGNQMASRLRREPWLGGFPKYREAAQSLSISGGTYVNLHPERNL